MLLKGKVAVITGAAGGIGAAMASGYAKEGARVVIADIADGQEAVAAVKKQGGDALYVKTDVTSQADSDAMAKAAVDAFGGIDILVNNAAMYANIVKKPFTEISMEEWNRVMEVIHMGVDKGWLEVAAEHRKKGSLTDEEYARFRPKRGFSPRIYRVTDIGRQEADKYNV